MPSVGLSVSRNTSALEFRPDRLDTLDGAHPCMSEPVVAVFCSRGMSSSSRCARLRTRPDCSIAA
jgi:hypothetical protein